MAAPNCPICNGPTTYTSGISQKTNKPWAAWKCNNAPACDGIVWAKAGAPQPSGPPSPGPTQGPSKAAYLAKDRLGAAQTAVNVASRLQGEGQPLDRETFNREAMTIYRWLLRVLEDGGVPELSLPHLMGESWEPPQ